MTDIVEDIFRIVGSKGILTGDAVNERPIDWRGNGSRQAKAIVRPANTQEVAAVLKICNDAKQNIVAIGGLTGLVRGTDSCASDILLSLERMTEIESIDKIGRTAIVQAGVALQKIQEAANELDLLFALDLGARGSCSVGGNIATNAGGNQVLRYGNMREQILGLEVVLADGTVLTSMNGSLKNNTGYDLKHLFIGSEGTLGIITKAVLRLHPRNLTRNTALVAISSFDALVDFFALISEQLAGNLTAFEVMWQDHYKLIAVESGRHQAPLTDEYAFYVIVEHQGMQLELDREAFSSALELASEKELLTDAVIAQSESQIDAFWSIREDIEGLAMALMPACVFDVSLPIMHMNQYINSITANVKNKWGAGDTGEDSNAKVVTFGHLGDGNLHIIISVGKDDEKTIKEINTLVYQPLQAIGGSISAEHGIGIEKKRYLKYSRSPEELTLMRLLKSSIDPNNILNPGKIFD